MTVRDLFYLQGMKFKARTITSYQTPNNDAEIFVLSNRPKVGLCYILLGSDWRREKELSEILPGFAAIWLVRLSRMN